MIRSILAVASIKRHAVKQQLPEAMLYITDSESAPFSFFRNIFWRRDISPDTEEGRCVLRHELHHVNARHSWDKAFMQIVLCAFWINPIFWLIRREIHMIHEFEADRASVKDNDASLLAAMILCTAYPYRELAGVNAFFKSPVKRRLMMLSRANPASLAYIRRLLTLPIAITVFAIWVFRAEATPNIEPNLTPTTVSDTSEIAKKIFAYKKEEHAIIIDNQIANRDSLAKVKVDNIVQVKVAKNIGGKDTILLYTRDNKSPQELWLKENSNEISKSSWLLNKERHVIVVDNQITDPDSVAKVKVDNIVQVKVAKNSDGKDTILLYTRDNKSPHELWLKENSNEISKSSGQLNKERYVIVADNQITDPDSVAKIKVDNIKQIKVAKKVAGKDTIIIYTEDDKSPQGVQIKKTVREIIIQEDKPNSKPSKLIIKKDTVKTHKTIHLKGRPINIQKDTVTTGRFKAPIFSDSIIKLGKVRIHDRLSAVEVVARTYPNFQPDSLKKKPATAGKPRQIIFKEIDEYDIPEAGTKGSKKSGAQSDTLKLGSKRVSSSILKKVDANGKKAAQFFDVDADSGQIFIIDGKEVDYSKFQALEPGNVESFSILKHKAAIDKYGERGSNGVIEITTRSDKTQP